MRAQAVAWRNAAAPGGLRLGAALLGLWLGAGVVACGADASDAGDASVSSEGQGSAERSTAQLEAAPGASEDSDDAPSAAGQATSDTESDASDAPDAASGDPLVLTGPSVLDPPEPRRPPTGELQTTRPVTSTEPVDVIVPPGECRFEYLGQGVRCENAGWPNVVQTDATDLLACMRECLQRDDCTGVTDYLWLEQPDLGCYLYLSTCNDPSFVADWGDEDGGHDFRRVCED